MNANELADVLMSTKFQVDEDGTMIGVSHQAVNEAVTMLRQQQTDKTIALEIIKCHEQTISQQQAELEALKAHPVKELTDEEIADFLYAYCLDMGDVYEASEAKLIECFRAILRKAQEK